MPVQTTYPGIYIEELPSSVHTVTAAPTSVTVFVGYSHPFKTQQFGKPIELFSFTDYARNFGGFFRNDFFDAESSLFGDLAQAVNQFFLNGGGIAWVVGLLPGTLAPVRQSLDAFAQLVGQEQADNFSFSTPFSYPGLTVTEGPWTFFPLEPTDADHQMQLTISNPQVTAQNDSLADVTITYAPPSSSPLAGYGTVAETYRQVSAYPYFSATGQANNAAGKANPNYIITRIDGVSSLVQVASAQASGAVLATGGPVTFPATLTAGPWQGNDRNGNPIKGAPVLFKATDFSNVFQQDGALDKLPIFNLLVIPGVTNNSVLAAATAFCERKRAFLIMDPPKDNSADNSVSYYPGQPAVLIEDTVESNKIPESKNSALYFPYLETNDPVTGLAINPVTNTPYEMAPSGTIAGIYASTDSTRGVWKAPAGLATTLLNVNDPVERGMMTDQRQGVLNPLAINCIRSFPAIGPVVWGARTSVAANTAFQQWMYIPVRRMALFLEQTLYSNLGWVVFEPNADPLWTSIRSSIESFMLGLYRQGAFQGTTPSRAFQVKCDNQTTTQADIDQGIVNIVVGFAPLKPAEFVVIQIAQLAGQAQNS